MCKCYSMIIEYVWNYEVGNISMNKSIEQWGWEKKDEKYKNYTQDIREINQGEENINEDFCQILDENKKIIKHAQYCLQKKHVFRIDNRKLEYTIKNTRVNFFIESDKEKYELVFENEPFLREKFTEKIAWKNIRYMQNIQEEKKIGIFEDAMNKILKRISEYFTEEIVTQNMTWLKENDFKKRKLIFPRCISIIDVPGKIRFDEKGHELNNIYFIKNGELCEYMENDRWFRNFDDCGIFIHKPTQVRLQLQKEIREIPLIKIRDFECIDVDFLGNIVGIAICEKAEKIYKFMVNYPLSAVKRIMRNSEQNLYVLEI